MSINLIKILSYSIFIAQNQNNKILTILLKDYVKIRVNKRQFLFILMLVVIIHTMVTIQSCFMIKVGQE